MVEVNPFGPTQKYENVPPVAVTLRFNVDPTQMGPLLPDAVIDAPQVPSEAVVQLVVPVSGGFCWPFSEMK